MVQEPEVKIKDKALRKDLERISKEVEAWPKWRRSIDLRDLNKPVKSDR